MIKKLRKHKNNKVNTDQDLQNEINQNCGEEKTAPEYGTIQDAIQYMELEVRYYEDRVEIMETNPLITARNKRHLRAAYAGRVIGLHQAIMIIKRVYLRTISEQEFVAIFGLQDMLDDVIEKGFTNEKLASIEYKIDSDKN